MIISDLLTLRPATPVIHLEDRQAWGEVSGSFVLTEDLRACLQDFAARLSRGEGGGVFVRGHYGSGKSHLLSFLALQAGDWKPLSGLLGVSGLTPLAAFPVSLQRWRADLALEDIAAEVIRRELPGLPAAGASRQDFYAALLAAVQASGRRGLLLLFDELSEYLKSKATPAALAEDLRFLQFLAEFAAQSGSWVIGAIQEEIEGVGSASRESSQKLKDRFPHRWVLGRLHLEEILSGRLLERRPGADRVVLSLHAAFRKRWPSVPSRPEDFLRTWPLHPVSVDLLAGLGRLFSEHRGALRFLQQVLEGGWRPGEPPFLERDAACLVTPDMLYDYFSVRLRETPQLRAFDERALAHLAARVAELVEPADRQLALKALKSLLLCTLDARKAGADATLLAACADESLGGSEEQSAAFLAGHVLGRLEGRANYLARAEGRYVVDLQQQGFELLGRVLAERLAGASLASASVRSRLLPLLDSSPLDLAQLWKDPRALGPVTWMNTGRCLVCRWGAGGEPADLRILCPGEDLSAPPEHVLTWTPRGPGPAEERALLEYAVLADLAEAEAATSLDAQVRDEAAKKRDLERKTVRRILEKLYLEGRWAVGETRLSLPADWHRKATLEGLLEDGAHELLARRHPRFAAVAPRIPYCTEAMLVDLMEGLVRRGEAGEAELAKNGVLDTAQGILRPWGLLGRAKGRARFTWSPATSTLAAAFEDLRRRHAGRVADLRADLARGEWGLTDLHVSFLLWCALASGSYRAMRKGQPVPEAKLTFGVLETVDMIEPVEGLPGELLGLLLANPFFRKAERGAAGPALQRELWGLYLERMRPAASLLMLWQDLRTDRGWAFAAEALKAHREVLSFFSGRAPQDALAGLEGLSFLAGHADRLPALDRALEWGVSFHRAWSRFGDELDRAWSYLRDEFLAPFPRVERWQDLDREREDLLAEIDRWSGADAPFPDVEGWMRAVVSWQGTYRGLYRRSHDQACGCGTPGEAEAAFRQAVEEAPELRGSLAARAACSRDVAGELMDRPFCRCNHRPGEAAGPAPSPYAGLYGRLRQAGFPEEGVEGLRGQVEARDWAGATARLAAFASAKPALPAPRRVSLAALRGRWAGRRLTRAELLRDLEEHLGPPAPGEGFVVEA